MACKVLILLKLHAYDLLCWKEHGCCINDLTLRDICGGGIDLLVSSIDNCAGRERITGTWRVYSETNGGAPFLGGRDSPLAVRLFLV